MKLSDIIDEIENQSIELFIQMKLPVKARLGKAAFAEFSNESNWVVKETRMTKAEDVKEIDTLELLRTKKFETSGGAVCVELDENLGPEEIVVEE